MTYKFVDEPAQSYKFVDEPAAPSGPLPSNAGVANFAASTLGLPMDTAAAAYNLFKAGIGTAQHKLLGTQPPELTTNPPGGSENIRGMLRATGVPGLSPDNPNPESKAAELQHTFVSRGGFVPGAALPAAGSMIAEKLVGPEWAGVGALAPQAAITAYNAARAPSLARQESQNAVRDSTIRAGRDEGYVVPPSATGGGWLSRRLESIAGKAAVGQEAAVRNQKITSEIARRELGLPRDAAISTQAIERRRDVLAEPYRQVAAIDPEAAQSLQVLRQTRADATNYWRHYDRSADPQSQTQARTLTAEAERLETYLEGIARNAGRPELVNELRQARRDIAKTHDVERALNLGTGDVSAPTIGRALDAGRPLSGGLNTIGRFQQAFPSYMREGERVPTPGVSKSEALMGSLLGLGGYSALGPGGVALAALPLASGPTRSALLSRPVQSGVLSPNYQPAVNPAPSPQLLYQLGILEQGQR